MFEIVSLKRRRWRSTLMKVRCIAAIDAERKGRTFEGHGIYSYQQYRLAVPEGATFTITAPRNDLLEVGDLLSFGQVAARGAFARQWRMIAST